MLRGRDVILRQQAGRSFQVRFGIAQLCSALLQVGLRDTDLGGRLLESGAHVAALDLRDDFARPDFAALQHAEPLQPAGRLGRKGRLALRDDIARSV